MPSRQETVSVKVSPDEKRAIRTAADDADATMSSFVRRKILDGLAVGDDQAYDGRLPPLKDFISARLVVDETAAPVAKATVYDTYVSFCESVYPEHDIESQHKVSREIGALDGVESGRAYVALDKPNPNQTRCFKNLRLAAP